VFSLQRRGAEAPSYDWEKAYEHFLQVQKFRQNWIATAGIWTLSVEWEDTNGGGRLMPVEN